MDKDYMAIQFTGKDLQEVATKMVLFLNSIKGLNLMNVPEVHDEEKSEADGERHLQGE